MRNSPESPVKSLLETFPSNPNLSFLVIIKSSLFIILPTPFPSSKHHIISDQALSLSFPVQPPRVKTKPESESMEWENLSWDSFCHFPTSSTDSTTTASHLVIILHSQAHIPLISNPNNKSPQLERKLYKNSLLSCHPSLFRQNICICKEKQRIPSRLVSFYSLVTRIELDSMDLIWFSQYY